MTIIQTVILAIIEGITEFLPVSSTGHLTLTAHALGIEQTSFVKSFEIFIQLGAILAIVFLYWKTLLQKKEIWLRIICAFIPTGILGLILYKVIKTYLIGNEWVTIVSLFIGGVLLILIELKHKKKVFKNQEITDISYKQAFFIGVFQSVSMIPGVSRAAATILGGQLLGASRKTAVEFSFLLALPTMTAATVLDLKESMLSFTADEFFLLGLGFMVSCVVAIITVKFFLNLIKTNTFIPFGIYRIFIAVLYWFIMLR